MDRNEMAFINEITSPSKSTLDTLRMASVLRVNDLIDDVRVLRDESLLPEEQAELINTIIVKLSSLKGNLLFK